MSASTNRKIIIYSIVLGAVCMAVMVYYGMHKQIEIVQDVSAQTQNENVQPLLDGVFDDVYVAENTGQPLSLLLPFGYNQDQVRVYEDYTHRCVQVLLKDMDVGEEYFRQHPLTGSSDGVEDIIVRCEDSDTILYIYLDQVCSCVDRQETDRLLLSFERLRETCDRIVVLDAAQGGEEAGLHYGGVQEKDVTLDILKRLKSMLEETGITVVCTRTEDETVTVAERLELVSQAEPDLLLSICCGLDEEDLSKSGVTAYYNEVFFIPEFGNADFAFEVEDKLIHATGGKALGLESGNKAPELLEFAMMPAACVEVGYLSNDSDRQLLKEDEYRQTIAEGLCDAIVSSFEQLGK